MVRVEAWLVLGARRQFQFQRCNNCLGDFVLYGEHVAHLAVVALRPQMIPVRRVDQLSADPNAAPRATHAAFENATDAESLADRSHVLVVATEGKCRRPRRHL